jgi:transposase
VVPSEEELNELEAELDPAARYIVKLLRQALGEMRNQLQEMRAQLAERDARLATMSEQLKEMNRLLFGRRSEKLPPIDSEVRRVLEREELTVEGEPMPEDPEQKKKERRRKARKKSKPARRERRRLRKNLPVVHEQVAVEPDALPEGYSLEDFRVVGGREPIRRIEHVREHLVVVEYQLQTLASKDGEHLVIAPAPANVVEGGHYGPSVYAHVVTAKCADSLPLYRIATMMKRAGCPIARSTLCDMFHRAAELLRPIYERLLAVVREEPIVHADETRLRVQAKNQCLSGWIWAVLSQRAVVYTFDVSRGGHVAERLLGGTEGELVIDGYSGYNQVTDENGRSRVGCWGHCRRKFFVAMSQVPEARELLDLIVELYRLEHLAAERDLLGTDAHALLRDTESRAVVKEIDAWVDEREGVYPPQSKMGAAITYATNQREALARFLDNVKLPLDNNFAERQLRIIATGRKNFLFAGHVQGAQNLAVLQSIVATCTLHRVNPYAYIQDLLLRMQTHPASRVDELMPWSWRAPPATGSPEMTVAG